MAEIYHNSALPPIVPSVELDMGAAHGTEGDEHVDPHSPRAKVSLAVQYGWLFLVILMFSFIWAVYGIQIVNSKQGANCSAKQPAIIRLATANVVLALFHFTTPLWIHCIEHLFPRRR